ncbi:MAG: branched-chain amino acid transport system permease protein [Thermoleophilaceae bacterium]|jgi:branched-chain amino acid transport system permease protein|nr:branched-chain amino acid transport system permease protein [Thermoleophilaceae bacterium]MEA2400697.1 branched-chain amino acid transport system permease protein [Thermoleophilaceae bacterium]
MTEFFQHLVNGLSVGSIYVLVAIGVTLVFGVSRLINFAHGQFLVLGSFLTWALVSAGLSFWLAVVIVPVLVGLFGVLVDRALLRPTLDRPENGFIVSLGLVIALEGLFTEIWSSDDRKVSSPVPDVLELAGTRIPWDRVVTLGVAAAGVAALYYILRRTDVGRSMRAAAENRDAAALLGVNVGRSISSAFFLGAFLAGIAGAFLAALFTFNPYTGTPYVIKGLAVALIGGLGSIEGALIIGMSLGVVESLGSAYGVGSEWRDGYAFIAMAVLLVWRPNGLFGGKREY